MATKSEVEKLKFLENLAKHIYTTKVKTDPVNGTLSVDLKPSELRELVAIETDIIKLRRLIYRERD